MIRKLFLFVALASILAPFSARGWSPNGHLLQVAEVINWETGGSAVIKLSDGTFCYIPESARSTAYPVILELFKNGEKASFHCHDTLEDIGGYQVRKLHRVVAVKATQPALASGFSTIEGYIAFAENGWFGEGLAIKLASDDGVPINFAGTSCGAAPDQFAVSADHRAYKEIVSIALSAYHSRSKVKVIVENGVCIFGARPNLLSIQLIR